MADTNGYIKLHRSILSWEWYGDIKTRGLFLHLLVAAQWEDVRIEGQVIKRGQLCTSIRKLSDVVGLSERGVRTSLQRLQSTGEITMQSNQHHSIITVVNYDLYQGSSAVTHDRHTKRHTTDTANDTQTDTPEQPTPTHANEPQNGYIERQSTDKPTESDTPQAGKVTQQTTHSFNENRHTDFSEIDTPSYINKKEEILRKEEVSARTRASGALSNVLETAVREYNENCKSLEPLTGELSYHQGRLVVEAFKELHGISFAEYFQRVEGSALLTGKSSSSFKADFNWLIRPENVAKVLSGKYDKNFESGAVTTSPAKKDYDEPLWDD